MIIRRKNAIIRINYVNPKQMLLMIVKTIRPNMYVISRLTPQADNVYI